MAVDTVLLYKMKLTQGDDQILDDRKTILDSLEKRADQDEKGSFKPLRRALEKSAEKIPSGPLGKIGEGNIASAGGYLAIKTGQLAVLPIPGVRQPGFHAISHGVEQREDFERHFIRINAASRQIAEIACEYEIASPSNIDYVTSEVETVEVTELKSRPTYSTWEFVVDVADRGQKEV